MSKSKYGNGFSYGEITILVCGVLFFVMLYCVGVQYRPTHPQKPIKWAYEVVK